MESIVKMGIRPGKETEQEASADLLRNAGVSWEQGISGASGSAPEDSFAAYGSYGEVSERGFPGACGGRSAVASKAPSGSAAPGKTGTGSPAARSSRTAGSSELPQSAKEQQRAQLKEAGKLHEEQERALLRRQKKQIRIISAYAVLTVVLCYVFVRLADNAGTVLSALVRTAKMIGLLLTPLFWGFVVAYILEPLVRMCEKRLRKIRFLRGRGPARERKKKLHGKAVAATCVLTLLAVALLLSVVVSAVSRSLKVASLEDMVVMAQSFAGTLDSFRKTIMARLNEMNITSSQVNSALREIGERIALFTKGLSTGVTGAVGHVGSFLTNALFTVIFAIYFLLDGSRIRRYWNRVLLAVGGRKTRRNFHILVKDADAVFSGYIRGQLLDALFMAVMISAALSLIGVRYAVIIGILSGIGNLIPYIGPVVAYASTILVSLLSGDFKRLLVALVVLFIIQTVDGNVINPRLLSSSIDVHPMLVIAALIVGGAFGGVVGMLFAVPVAAFLKIQFDKIITRMLRARMPEKEKNRTPEKESARKSEKDSSGAGGGENAPGAGGARKASPSGRAGRKKSSARRGAR
ncbi:MAG: AI-2E family transporter [Eubacteriales bacterium]|nr:AI-2E family transporter [Eubacteriales bacterium]